MPRRVQRTRSGDSSDLSLSASPGLTPMNSLDGFPPRSRYDEPSGSMVPQKEMTGFDVLDFLDGILNDRNVSVVDAEKGEADLIVGDLSVEGSSTQLPIVASNPWATPNVTKEGAANASNERQSRLSAYGISIEDESEHRLDESLNLPSLAPGEDSLPLLTPAAILSSEVEQSRKGQSFYAHLLGEDC